MLSTAIRLYRWFSAPGQTRSLRRHPHFFCPRLEILEDRLVPDAMTFVNPITGLPSVGSYTVLGNWTDLGLLGGPGPAKALPGANDTADIPVGASCTLSSLNEQGLAGLTVEGSMAVASPLSVSGNATISGSAAMTVSSQLSVSGTTSLTGSATLLIGSSSDPNAEASLDTDTFDMDSTATATVGGPSGGSNGSIDATFATLGDFALLNLGDPGTGLGGNMDVSNTMTMNGGTLIVGGAGGSGSVLDVYTLNAAGSNATTVNSGGEIDVKNTALFGGPSTVYGEIKAENGGAFDGGSVVLGGTGTVSGANGKLVAEINGSFTFFNGSTWTIGAGNPVGSALNDGQFFIGGTLNVNTALNPDGDITLDSSGLLAGSGSLDEWHDFTWNGGTLSIAGGTTIEPSSDFKMINGGTLASNLTNISSYTELQGGSSLNLTNGAIFDNAFGTTAVSIPNIVTYGGGTFINDANGTLEVQTPLTIFSPFTNTGTLDVSGGSSLTLSPSSGADELDGTLDLEGVMTLLGTFVSSNGLIVNGSEALQVGDDSGDSGSLALSQGANIFGHVEVTGSGTLTSDAQLSNEGTLTLDLGGVNSLASYQQASYGTLELQQAPSAFTTLSVTGSAALAGTVDLQYVDGYTPSSGTAFTVVTAGSIGGHFDVIPDGMTATYNPTNVILTQN